VSTHLLVWSGLDGFRTEVAQARFDGGRLSARGTQIGVEPEGYRLDYRLETDDRLRTTRLEVELQAPGWSRSIDLRRDAGSRWECDAAAAGDPELPPAGGDMRQVEGAEDCDLAFSPLTNLMPVRRERLLDQGSRDFLMAWVAVPSLAVHPSEQRYEHVRRDGAGSVVRYVGRHRDFVGELRFDEHGLVRLYPELALRRFPPVSADDVAAAGPVG
jgi:hypothetical protein